MLQLRDRINEKKLRRPLTKRWTCAICSGMWLMASKVRGSNFFCPHCGAQYEQIDD